MWGNVVCAGGSTLLGGFAGRLAKELREVAPSRLQKHVEVFAPPERAFSTWIGGSILASLDLLSAGLWLSKGEYDEHGPAVLHRKCTWMDGDRAGI